MLFFENKWVDGCELDNFEIKAQDFFLSLYPLASCLPHTFISTFFIFTEKKANDNEVKGKVKKKTMRKIHWN